MCNVSTASASPRSLDLCRDPTHLARNRDDPTIMAWSLANEPRCQGDYSGATLQVHRHGFPHRLAVQLLRRRRKLQDTRCLVIAHAQRCPVMHRATRCDCTNLHRTSAAVMRQPLHGL